MAIIKKDGITVAVTPNPSAYFDQLVQDGLSSSGYSVEYSPEEKKQQIRQGIYTDVADLDSLAGATADVAQVLVLFACADAVALAKATDFADYKQSRMDALSALSGGTEGAENMVQHAGKLLTDVQSGAVVMPFLIKPEKVAGVFNDVATQATAVAKVLLSGN